MTNRLDEKLQFASSAYDKGYSCAQSVLYAYQMELGISEDKMMNIMTEISQEKGWNDMCDVIVSASIIIRILGSNCSDINDYLEQIHTIFKKEYGGSTCNEILQGKDPRGHNCQMKVKDMILVIEQILYTMQKKKEKKYYENNKN